MSQNTNQLFNTNDMQGQQPGAASGSGPLPFSGGAAQQNPMAGMGGMGDMGGMADMMS